MSAVTVHLNVFTAPKRCRRFCTFEYKYRTYIVTQEFDAPETDVFCRQLKWNPWLGAYENYNFCPKAADEIACILMELADEQPTAFKMTGQHYLVQKKEVGYRLLEVRRSCYLYGVHWYLPLLVRTLVALIAALMYGLLYINTGGIRWAGALFPGLSRNALTALLWTLQITGVLAILLFNRFRRNTFDLAMDVLVPLNTVTLIGACRISAVFRWVILTLAVLLFLILVLPKAVFFLREKRRSRRKKKFWTMIRCAMLPGYICVIAGIVLSAFMEITGASYVAESGNDDPPDEAAILERFDRATGMIRADVWEGLLPQERIDVLQWISDYECVCVLGCPSARVQTAKLDDTTLGDYNPYTNTITVNVDYLLSLPVKKILCTLLHESRHAWQETVRNMYNDLENHLSDTYKQLKFFRMARQIRDNSENYQDSDSDFELYREQTVEEDARAWAEYEIERYTFFIRPPESGDDGAEEVSS